MAVFSILQKQSIINSVWYTAPKFIELLLSILVIPDTPFTCIYLFCLKSKNHIVPSFFNTNPFSSAAFTSDIPLTFIDELFSSQSHKNLFSNLSRRQGISISCRIEKRWYHHIYCNCICIQGTLSANKPWSSYVRSEDIHQDTRIYRNIRSRITRTSVKEKRYS